MKIQDLFQRRIDRHINGVVKADQLDANSVWQELDEFVVTRELSGHISKLVDRLVEALDSPAIAADTNGIWVSGFFGCGKSHFIKVLSYVLENAEHEHNGEHRHAVDFFDDKLGDAMLFGDLKRIVAKPTETILFNIDSKADHQSGRDALLQVFLKVLNEKQGFSGDHAHIAHMERHLEERDKLDVFHAAFERESGSSWTENRDAWSFHRDEVIVALAEALGQSKESAEKWVDSGESSFSLTVENFAKWTKAYLDRQGPDHRVMFLVDEVGQFIGNDTHLMLNLQTITEQLGTVCKGRAWVVVTSQEDLDAVLGDLKNRKQHDFSKIQGRFQTRLSLSSNNVDEVIKRRLLTKHESAIPALTRAYDGKHDILKNQLSFVNTGMTFEYYADVEDFAACYPFAAYEFKLVQKVFESIRKAGATGLHLSQGERSTLDAFQSAAKMLAGEKVGALVPFYRFYPAVEGFLDTAVKRTIDQAKENHALEPFDATILQVLFLIRYIDELPGNIENLVTLCIDEIDADRLELKRKIAASLERLEGETLIARNGELYFFLTNEERDISREIKNHEIPSGSEERELGKLIFEDLLGDIRKHSYSLTGKDFNFSRLCDDHVIGSRLEGSLEVAFVSPLGDRHAEFSDDAACVIHTTAEEGRVLVVLPDDSTLGREVRAYIQTEAYVKAKQTNTIPDTTKRILRDRNEENRERRRRIVHILGNMLGEARFFASGEQVDVGKSAPKDALGTALEYLIRNAYPKMGYLDHLHDNPKQEIQSTLRANDVEQMTMGGIVTNVKALDEVREYLRLSALKANKVVLHDMLEKRFGLRPYGWPELETVLLVARLAVLREINLIVSSAPLPLDQAYEHLTSASKQRKVIISIREAPSEQLIKDALQVGKSLFGKQGPNSEEELFDFLKSSLDDWNTDLGQYEPLAETGKYPGLREIRDCLGTLKKFVAETDSLRFLKRFVELKDDLGDLAEDLQDLRGFYSNQKHSWENLRSAVERLSQNRLQLEADDEAGPALRRMQEIIEAPRPYGMLAESARLIETAEAVNKKLLDDAREPALRSIQTQLDGVKKELENGPDEAALHKTATSGLEKLLQAAASGTSIAHIAEAQTQAELAFDQAMTAIEKARQPIDGGGDDPEPKVKPRCVIDARTHSPSTFIETPEQLETFLERLRSALEQALNDGNRIQIK